MTGLQTHKIPCFAHPAPFPTELPTWAHMLRHAGYHTELNGKMHFVGPDQLHGFHVHRNEHAAEISGFRWGEENPDPTSGKRYWIDLHFEGDKFYEKRMGEENSVLRDSVRFLKEAPSDRPWAYVASFAGPHYPQILTREMFDSYGDTPIPEPRSGLEGLHPRHQHWAKCWGFDRLSAEENRIGRQAYLGMITHVDEWIGEILQALEQSGQAENTIIVYTADHGEMWAEHGLWGKQVFFEDSAPVPLIVSAPHLGFRSGEVIDTPVSLLDFYPTFRDWAGIDRWNIPLDGRSLANALTDNAPLEDVPVFCEYDGADTKGPERMVRYRHLKLNYYHNQGSELFDLSKDPLELNNVAEDPAYRADRDQLWTMLTDGWDPVEVDRRVRLDQEYRTLVGESLER
jgi:choline-sulfatase